MEKQLKFCRRKTEEIGKDDFELVLRSRVIHCLAHFISDSIMERRNKNIVLQKDSVENSGPSPALIFAVQDLKNAFYFASEISARRAYERIRRKKIYIPPCVQLENSKFKRCNKEITADKVYRMAKCFFMKFTTCSAELGISLLT
jgi:hypothetical protein